MRCNRDARSVHIGKAGKSTKKFIGRDDCVALLEEFFTSPQIPNRVNHPPQRTHMRQIPLRIQHLEPAIPHIALHVPPCLDPPMAPSSDMRITIRIVNRNF